MSARPTAAMVLAAGMGTRMRPLTDDKPKPMVQLAGRPLIDHVLARLAAAGIRRAVVNVHYKAEVLEAHLALRRGPPEVVISDERGLLLDTGGGLQRGLPALGAGPFVVHNSDTVWIERTASNIERLIAAFDPDRSDAVLLLAERVTSLGYDGPGDFALGADGLLQRRRPGETVPYAFAGVSIATAQLLDGMPGGAFSLNRPWDRALAAGRLHGLVLEGRWMHVGDPVALAAAELALLADG